jgi:hypothetical protein
MAMPKMKKLNALALCNLLPIKDLEILKYTGIDNYIFFY